MRGKWIPNSIMVLALVSGAGSLALFGGSLLGSLAIVRVPWSEAGVLWWDSLLSLAFFLQHSGMVRRGFRARLSAVVPPRYHRALYSIASGIALTSVTLLWQPSHDRLVVLGGPFRWAAHVLAILAMWLFLWGTFAVRDLDLFGTRDIKAHARSAGVEAPAFVIRGPYRWVRHPWYLGAILLFWSCTDLTADRLLFNVLWTGWVCLATRLEEADLVRDFGEVYEEYRRQVPMLIPWRHPE